MTKPVAALAATLLALALPLGAQGAVSQADRFYREVRAGHDAAAIDDGRLYLAQHPRDDAFAVDLAYAYLRLGDLTAVRAILRQHDAYLAAHRDAASLWLELSYRDSSARAYPAAIDDVDRYLRDYPGDTQAWRQRAAAVAAVQPHAPDESVLFYQAVTARDPAAAIPHGVRYLAAAPGNSAFAVDLAFAYLQARDLDAALALEARYDGFVASDPKGRPLLAALFYACNDAGRTDVALAFGRRYLALDPNDDAFAVDLAYAELRAHDLEQARAIIAAREPYLRSHPQAAKLWMELAYREGDAERYERAIDDTDRYLALQPGDASARAQRTAYEADLWGGPHDSTYAYSYYDSRFDDVFLGLDQIVTLAPARGLQPYVTAHLTEDTRSGAPGAPQIYSDDSLALDGGVRFSIGPSLRLFLESGTGIGLRGQGTITDLRYGLLYSGQWRAPDRSTTTADVSAAYYSRYAGNDIAYYDVFHIFAGGAVRPLVGVNGGLDAHRVFGNNFIEALYGVQIGHGALFYRIYGVEGDDLTRGLGPVRPVYSSLRAMVVGGF